LDDFQRFRKNGFIYKGMDEIEKKIKQYDQNLIEEKKRSDEKLKQNLSKERKIFKNKLKIMIEKSPSLKKKKELYNFYMKSLSTMTNDEDSTLFKILEEERIELEKIDKKYNTNK